MKIAKLLWFSSILQCILFAALSIFGQNPSPTVTPQNTDDHPNKINVLSEENLVHPGDVIEIDVVGSFEFDWSGTVTPEGFLSGISFVESPIYALCRTEEEIAAEVRNAYSKFLREPIIVVKILDRSRRPFSILLGAVKNAQRFQINRPVYLNELLIIAGGLTERASGEIQIFRSQKMNCSARIATKTSSGNINGQSRERFVGSVNQDNGSQYLNIRITDLLMGKKEANPQILSGDVITVLEAKSVYVIGGVANPQRVLFRFEMTLSRAIDSAGGLTKNAEPRKITVFRRSRGETEIIEADLQKIKAGLEDDILLQPYDIVEVIEKGGTRRNIAPIVAEAALTAEGAERLPLRIID